MQDGWGDEETLMSGPRHSSWEEEEGDSVMWNSNISQDSNSSSNWTSKKMAPKVRFLAILLLQIIDIKDLHAWPRYFFNPPAF